MVGDLHIRIAQLDFHAKESPSRTRDEVFNLVSSWTNRLAHVPQAGRTRTLSVSKPADLG